ncbi:Asp-tRNA(Asn)/Glu-tRNA(Gln) amidotransferase subunit GatA [Chondromyces crocatus]|uniref:Glutamyl-tRNA(Gln) amidotransferase subunit A n=1 Tax=Chondromyces crocatus TaxID=52 RepID=A0A0K1EJN6_CHOCO|nr:Asp-tRNA(Asn)/Glu-tRNA(Gln) amidotransferase subunit GatA [Chondromyces crocatus]AKT41059.1 glutamyl-tRNA(Gln) amidotransferase [Chondromyces crocatus]
MTEELLDQSIPQLAARCARGEVSAEEITRAALARIERQNPQLGAFLSVQSEEALRQAREVDGRRSRGEPLGPLAGVPIGLKDSLCAVGAPATAASAILTRRAGPGEPERDHARGWHPPYDATTVARLRAAGAIFPGKCNQDEFAMGSSNENSAFTPARNPWDPERIPGGSSGGSAVAVAARMTPGSLGSDTGGSIRQPAALTGVVGVKPTYGRVSRYGLIAFASSLDQVGPFATDVRGAARLLEVIAGHDPRDATSLAAPVGAYEAACDRDVAGLRIGVPEEYFAEGLEPGVGTAVRAALDGLRGLGCEVRPIHLAHTRYAVATYYIVATAEASSNLSRFDGVRFGLREEGRDGDLRGMYGRSRDLGFGPEVKRRIMLGTYVLSTGYYDAYYLRAQKVRTLIRRDFEEVFRDVDVVAAPVAPTTAFKLGEKSRDPLSMYLADVYTLPASLAGLPALSVPCGLSTPEGGSVALPVGLQLIGPSLHEERLFTLASAWEQISPVKTARPRTA